MMTFDEWVETLPAKHWAKYDLAACRVGWDAGRASADNVLNEIKENAASAHILNDIDFFKTEGEI